jgi:uncharacterized protein YjbI with pentapeptide repeats
MNISLGGAAPDAPVLTTQLQPSSSEFADKAKDLQALRDTVVDAAGVGAGLWLSYLFVLFYLLIAVGGVTHRDLLLENPVKLPFLNVDLPLIGFFVLGPAMFLVVHSYVLIHFALLADKVGAFHAELQAQIANDELRTRLRRQLPSNIFVQILAGPREVRAGVLGFMLQGIAQISLVVAPVGLLIFFQLQFLPYHNEVITWWQRIAMVVDLVILWVLWPSVVRGEGVRLAWVHLSSRPIKLVVMALVSAVPVLLAFTISTFPGERMQSLPSLQFIPWAKNEQWRWTSLHELFVAGEVDFTTRKATSFWSNRIVLPAVDVIDHSKFDTEAKLTSLPTTLSLRARHLEGAVLIGSTLRKVDFTAAWLQGAKFGSSDLREAKFECDASRESTVDGPQLRCAQLQGASFVGSQLQGSSFVNAELTGALFYRAKLQGAAFIGAELRGAALDGALLHGASFDSAHLEGASLVGSQLQGAVLDYALLHGASLDGAQLQGATLHGTQLQNASLRKVFAWRADARKAFAKDAHVDADTSPKEACLNLLTTTSSGSNCDWSIASYDNLKESVAKQVPESKSQRDALARIQRLDPRKPLDGEAQMSDVWSKFKVASPP